jgi:molecular chaperone DnaK
MYFGIDLGTTNSCSSWFDGEKRTVLRSAQGGALTPSVVRIDGRGNVTCGLRARRFLESDPGNTHGEFKRLMGTAHTLSFAAAKLQKKPEELAAVVLSTLRADFEQAHGFAPAQAVVAVPALFELPQSAATAEAARLAGFDRIELLQEPVASALASGWTREDARGAWLVYDLGGGTFDASLLESKEGLLRIVGHDGDNFLGGRDIDAKLCEYVVAALEKAGTVIDRKNPANATALRRLRLACEEAKIDASRGGSVTVTLPALPIGGDVVDVDVAVPEADLRGMVLSVADASIDVCLRLLERHGLAAGGLERVVLVGGPTLMPLLRERVRERLGAQFAEGLDAMTLVAEGAALFAGTSDLKAKAKVATAPAVTGPRLWLQHAAVTSDVAPYVVGKLVTASDKGNYEKVVFTRTSGDWESSPEAIDAEGTFTAALSLIPRTSSEFEVWLLDKEGKRVAAEPARISVRHGITIGDPPLSRSVGVALENGYVRTFFERGSPLPLRRTYTLKTAVLIAKGMGDFALRIPIVQGEFPFAHLCRQVGSLEIPASAVEHTVAAGTPVEIALSVDRGGALTAQARIAGIDRVFDGVAHLVTASLTPAELRERTAATRKRIGELYVDRIVARIEGAREALGKLDGALDEVERGADLGEGGDADALEKARRRLLEVDTGLAEVEMKRAWPELDEECADAIDGAVVQLGRWGTETERQSLDQSIARLRRSRQANDVDAVKRELNFITSLRTNATLRNPDAWPSFFESASSRIEEAHDMRRAHELVQEGRAALAKQDMPGVERATRALWQLLPSHQDYRSRGLGSGVR